MSNDSLPGAHSAAYFNSPAFAARLRRRYRSEKIFRVLGVASIAAGLVFLTVLLLSIVANGWSAYWQTHIALDVTYTASKLDGRGEGKLEDIAKGDFAGLAKTALRELFPEVSARRDRRALYRLVSNGAAFELRDRVLADTSLIGTTERVWVPADDDIDMLVKGYIDRTLPPSSRRVSDQVIGWVEQLEAQGRIDKRFNSTLFSAGDSREPELAGIRGALMGSMYMLLVTLVLAFPVGVGTAIYLEEFAPRNRFTDLIEVNINNLAAVPSIVFGLLGLAVFLNFFELPRSAPLVGGLVLTLMTLPTIIIAARASLKAVPPSIREAALGVGASKMQMVLHHVLPLAMPGMLTGTIIGMAQALGESAPLLMIGMVAFVVDIPGGLLDPSTALPVQVYLWADSPERAFVERTAAAIMVLLGFLVVMNAVAVLLRRRFERRW